MLNHSIPNFRPIFSEVTIHSRRLYYSKNHYILIQIVIDYNLNVKNTGGENPSLRKIFL